MLNASRTAVNGSVAMNCSGMNSRSSPEHIMFKTVQILRSLREERLSKYDDVTLSVTAEVGRVYYTEQGPILISYFTL